MDPGAPAPLTWLRTGRDGLAAMLELIGQARTSVALEIYILQDCEVGDRFRQALAAAARRGVRVRVLVDAFGSLELPAAYLQPVIDAGGDCRWFNPLELGRFPYRDHRKLLLVDDVVAVVGGFNIGRDYDGDGLQVGWRDLGAVVRGAFLPRLAEAFDDMFAAASFRHQPLSRFRRRQTPQQWDTAAGDVFLLSPGRGRNPAREALVLDVRRSRRVRLTTAYFLPPRALRRAMTRAVRDGASVQLILPGRSDVRIAQMAARGHYARLLRAGVEIYEYQPAVLHTKRYLLDDVVYVGSANLDLRSLSINYELLLRVEDPGLAAEGHEHFEEDLRHCRRIDAETWRRRSWWSRLTEHFASFFLVRLDARFALRQLHRLRERGPRLRWAPRRRLATKARPEPAEPVEPRGS